MPQNRVKTRAGFSFISSRHASVLHGRSHKQMIVFSASKIADCPDGGVFGRNRISTQAHGGLKQRLQGWPGIGLLSTILLSCSTGVFARSPLAASAGNNSLWAWRFDYLSVRSRLQLEPVVFAILGRHYQPAQAPRQAVSRAHATTLRPVWRFFGRSLRDLSGVSGKSASRLVDTAFYRLLVMISVVPSFAAAL